MLVRRAQHSSGVSDVYIISDTKKQREANSHYAQNIVTTSFIEWRAASSLEAISSADQLQWVRTTRTCSPPDHWVSVSRVSPRIIRLPSFLHSLGQ